MRRLICGAWTGEFGWELMSWQGYLRRQAKGYDEVVVAAPKGHEALYADFCTSYLPHCVSGDKNCWWVNAKGPELELLERHLASMEGVRLKPERKYELDEQDFVRFGKPGLVPPDYRFDVIMHVRAMAGRSADRSWAPGHANEVASRLLRAGYKVAASGTAARCPDGVTDIRGMALDVEVNILSAARLMIGPCSGPIHLAALCGLPALVWTDKRYWSMLGGTNRQRLERLWNPLNTPVHILEGTWEPSIVAITDCAMTILGKSGAS